jgi:hypothetical protein
VKGTFRSLSGFNYRMWAGGALVSNVGTWMQRTAQDWIVLTQLTHHTWTGENSCSLPREPWDFWPSDWGS